MWQDLVTHKGGDGQRSHFADGFHDLSAQMLPGHVVSLEGSQNFDENASLRIIAVQGTVGGTEPQGALFRWQLEIRIGRHIVGGIIFRPDLGRKLWAVNHVQRGNGPLRDLHDRAVEAFLRPIHALGGPGRRGADHVG